MQKRFNHYYLTEQIDSKPLRSVYLAHHVNDVSQKVLLKIFDATCLALNQESEQLLQQVKWIKQLRHTHLVSILDLGVEQGQPYVVSEYLSGGSLRHRLDSLSPGRLSLEEALSIILQAGQALPYFHKHGHLHGNIKPENIFFNERDEVLLADFRLSGFIDVTILGYQSDPRTICYMAPEQFIGSASEKSDQYALACLAYELIAGQVPFSAQSFAMMWANHYAQVPTPLSNFVPDLPESIEKAVFKAMAKNPSERYLDVSTFLLALRSAALLAAPAIARPSAISALDSFSTSVAEPLENRKSDAPIEASLAGPPVEGSLAGAPFGTSLASAPFGTSLASASFGMSLASAPFGTSLAGAPFGTSLAGNPFEKSLAGDSLTTSLAGEAFEASLAGDSLMTSLEGDLLEKNLEENPFETSQEEDSLKKALEENPFETSLADTPLTNRLLERWEHVRNNPDANKAGATGTPGGKAHIDLSWVKDFFQSRKYSIPARWLVQCRKSFTPALWLVQLRSYLGSLLSAVRTGSRRGLWVLSKQPLITRFLERWERMSSERRANKAAVTDTPAEEAHINPFSVTGTPAGKAHINPFSVGRIFQSRRYSIPVLWFGQRREFSTPALVLMLVLSIIILIGGVISYTLLASHSPNATKSVNNNQKRQIVVSARNAPIDTELVTQPIAHATVIPTPQKDRPPSLSQPVQTSLTGNYAKQSQIYNLSTEGRLDWVNWGLSKPEDVNRRSGVQQQISTFAVISSEPDTSIVQRASYNANAKLWWSDGTPVMTAQPQQASGIYVTGMSTGFRLSVPTSTTPRTLKVYVAVNGARGKFMASLNGKTYVDESLSTAYNANGPQANGIYTLVFNGSIPDQLLTVTYTAVTTDGNGGYVLLQAATLH